MCDVLIPTQISYVWINKVHFTYIEWPDGTTLERSFPTGKHSSNYKAEATALEEAADILSSPISHEQNVVF